jgi:hypothetical protein
MSAWLVALCGVIYLYVAVEQALRGQPWIAVMYAGYALANVGAYVIAQRGLA